LNKSINYQLSTINFFIKGATMQLVVGCTTRPYGSWSFAEACQHIAAAGYTDVAVFANKGKIPVRSDSTPQEIAETRQVAVDAGLVPSMLIGRTNIQLGLSKAIDEYKRLIDNTALLGAKWLLDGGISNKEHYENYFELMRQAAPQAQQAGVNITLKPHGGITLTIEDLINAYQKVNHPAFGICYDPGNIIYYTKGELRPEPAIDTVSPMVNTGIIKDCVVNNGVPDVMITAGEGLVDFQKVLAGLIRGGFRGPLYVECVGGKELDEINRNVKSTRKFVNDILAKM
jgi:sugar phosphate isomerase/epimerase